MKKIITTHFNAALIIGVFLLTMAVALPLSISPIGALAINPLSDTPIMVMDAALFYDVSYVNDIFAQLGERGMEIYRTFHIFDCLFAVLYGLFFSVCLRPLLVKKQRWIAYCIGILPAIMDICENTTVDIMSMQYPNISAGLADTAAVFSGLKWLGIIVWLAVLIVLSVRKLVAKKQPVK